MTKQSTTRRGATVLALVLVGAIASAVLPASAGTGKYLKKSMYRNSEGIFTTSVTSVTNLDSVGAMGSGALNLADLGTVSTLRLPAGHFAIFGKAWVQLQDSEPLHVHCALVAENDVDHARTQTGAFDASLALEVAHTFGEPGSVTLECADDASGRLGSSEPKLQFIQLIAIRAPSLSR